MRLALPIAFALAGCVPPAQQPSYYAQPSGQPPPGGAPPAAAAAASASCQDTLTCYGQCNPMTDACVGACDQRTTPASSQDAHAVLQCMAQSGCQDQGCVAQQCGAQITTCTNVTVAAAPVAPAGGGCEEVMQPEYYVGGSLKVPPPRCTLSQSDFAGVWESGVGTGEAYYDSSGNNTGWSAVSTASRWTVDANGGFRDDWKGAYTSSSAGMPRGSAQTTTGTLTAENNNTITIAHAAADGRAAYTEHYIVVGWFAGASEITMTLNGPFRDPITQQDLDDAQANSYRNQSFHRKR